MSDIIKIEQLNKCFGDVKAVNDLSFRVKKGELFAFLGVNGAGKSTTISIICGQLRKDSGNVWIKDKKQTGQAVKQRGCWELCFRTVFLINLLQLRRILKAGQRCMELLEFHSKKDWQNWWRYLISGITLTDRLVSCQADREEELILQGR